MGSVPRGEPRRRVDEVESALGMKRYWIRSFVGVALVLLVLSVLTIYFLSVRGQAQDRQLLMEGSRVLAQTVAADLAHIRALLSAVSVDSGLREAFISHQPEQLRAQERALMATVPEASSIHLFAAEQIQSVDGAGFMSYAGLDLAREATQSRSVTQIEAHKVGQADMHLAVAAPVLDASGEQSVGVVHVALPISKLQAPEPALVAIGIVRYQQVVGDSAVTLRGDSALPDRDPDYIQHIGGTRMQVAVWIEGSGWVDPWLAVIVVVVYLFIVGVIGAILRSGYQGLRRDLMADCQGFVVVVDDAVHRRPLPKLKLRLSETQEAHMEVVASLRSLKARRAPPRGGASESPQAGETDDLTESSSYFDSVSVEVGEIDLPDSIDMGAQASEMRSPARPNPLEEFDPLEQLESIGAEPRTGAVPISAVPHEIFRAYDIRGRVGTQLTKETMRAIGQALGSEAADLGDSTLMVARDCRSSSPELTLALSDGIRAAGMDVVDLGIVPTPLLYFACCHPEAHAGAMVTGSHNPPEYNGVKPVLMGQSAGFTAILGLSRRIEQGKLNSGSGGYETKDILALYRERIEHDVALARNLKLVIDCGNATTAALAPDLFRALGCEVIELNCDMDAGMGELMPDPSVPGMMRDLGDLVLAQGADIGLAFDGDGDRLGVVDSQGRFIAADRIMMLLAADILARNPGSDVVFDVKCSSHLVEEIRRAGGRPVMWRSGHTPLKEKLRESGALIAGELSGHFMFKDRWFGFDDAIYAGARLLEVLSLDPRPSQEVFAALPGGIATAELFLPLSEGEPARVMESVLKLARRLDGVDVILIDGLRAEFDRGWGLVRASNTQPNLSFRFEGDDAESLEKIQALFRRIMGKAAPGLNLPF